MPTSILGVTALYILVGTLGLRLAIVHPSVTAVWPPTGVALAACLLLGSYVWPGVFLGAFLVNVITADAIVPSFGIACGNTLEALVGAFLVNRYAHGRHAFDRALDIFRFTVLAAFLSTMLSATVGVASLAWSGLARWTDYGAIWWTWWLGDAMGALLVTPLLLSWSTTRRWPWRRSGFLEALLVFLAVVCLGLLVFVGLLPNSAQQPLAFLGVPLLAWLAFRSSQREVTTTVAVLAGIALWGTLHGFGPFARERSNVALLLLQTFMGVTAVTTTVVAAVVAELKDAKGALMQLNEALEQRVQERTTDLEEAMAERQRLEQEAQRVHYFALLGRLAAGISHDIRNPLASVSLQVEVLEEELRQPSPEGPAYITQAFAEIKTNLVRLENLVQDYLSLVRVAAIRTEPLELGAFVTQFAQEMTATLAAHGITLHLEGLDQLGIVALHPNTFRRVLLNMTQNALDAMPHGGTLTLEGRGTATEVQLRIRDTGSGITAEHLPQMFEPLYTTKPGGTGLGLYIVQEIVAAHKGHVTVESVAGQGTTMTLTMPRLLTAATAPAVQ